MSELSESIAARTSKPAGVQALVMLEDGTSFSGVVRGIKGEVFGEVCFNTSLTGYLEVVTDPSYAGQVVIMAYPQIGNYGVCREDLQSAEPALRALIVRDLCYTPSNFRSELSLPQYLEEQGILAVEGVDTRTLIRHVRDAGAMKVGISTECLDEDTLLSRVRQSEELVGQNLVQTVSAISPYMRPGDRPWKVVAVDCGAKESIFQQLEAVGCQVQVVPWDASAGLIMSYEPEGVFLSNGPGDPDAVDKTCETVRELLGKVPLFGICFGHQMIARAAGARIEKLKFGHHGGNQPVMDLTTRKVEVTVQNHGFGIIFESLGTPVEGEALPTVEHDKFGRIQLTHENLNDGTPEGIRFLDIPAFSVQYHPEASPGPQDSRYLFERFVEMMEDFHA